MSGNLLLHEFYVDGNTLPGTTWDFMLNALSNITPRLRATVVGLRMLSPMTIISILNWVSEGLRFWQI